MNSHDIRRAQYSPILTALVFVAMAAAAAAQQPAGATNAPDTPGTGRFPAMKEEVASLPAHVVYRPKDLSALGTLKLGVVAWGNGGCSDDGASTRLHLLEIASHGYLVIASGRILSGPGAPPREPRPAAQPGQIQPPRTKASDLTDAIDWAFAENAHRGSPFFGRIAPALVALSGWSCGGLQALQVAKDPRVKTMVLQNTGVLNDGPGAIPGMDIRKDVLATLHTPTLYILGGPKDIAYANGMDDFARISHVPVAVANLPVGHGGTYFEPNGGAAASVAASWLDWQLRGDLKSAERFVGEHCGLCDDPQWTLQRKQFPAVAGAAKSVADAATTASRVVAETDCTAPSLVATIAPSAIGEPVRSVALQAAWVAATDAVPAHCRVDGVLAPVDTAPTARAINFRVILPASWNRRAAQLGGGGINGVIPNLTGAEFGAAGPSLLSRGFATYGSDSGHQLPAFGRRGGPPPAPPDQEWALNEEAIRNFGYAQMKKTHDAAMMLIQRMYGERPRFNYYIGTSQGGREALTVAQRYPGDYDGIAANVPIVNFSSLMLAPELIRIHEKPLANWVTPAKINAIRGEFIRQCDALDGLADGIVNNYMACRATFDLSRGAPNRHPWAAKRCPNNVDSDPSDTSPNACLTDGQISTLEFVYSHYKFASPLAGGVREFGMWLPNTDPSGSGLILPARFRGQEGAPADAPMHSHLGVLGVTGFLMQDIKANALDYVEGGALNERRRFLSEILDSTSPDFRAFARRGGKMIVAIGTNDTLASPGSQLDFYQSVIDEMKRAEVDRFARFYVMPQTGHGLSGTNYGTTGDGKTVATAPIPNTWDRLALLFDWVERGVAPGMSITVTAGEKSLPLCSYPTYPRYVSGPEGSASSYRCRQPD